MNNPQNLTRFNVSFSALVVKLDKSNGTRNEKTMNFRNTRSAFAAALLCCSFLLIQACASIDPDYEQPTVTLSSFKALPSGGGMPTFEIGLHVLNPNSSPFRLEGIVYTISVQGHDVVKGVGKDFPVLEGYSEQTVKLTATANLLAGIRLVMDMMNTPAEDLQYEFEAKLDTGGFGRSIRVKEKGSFRMNGKDTDKDISDTPADPIT